MTIVTTQSETSSRPSTNLLGNQIRMSGLYMDHRKFEITPKDKF